MDTVQTSKNHSHNLNLNQLYLQQCQLLLRAAGSGDSKAHKQLPSSLQDRTRIRWLTRIFASQTAGEVEVSRQGRQILQLKLTSWYYSSH